MKKEFSQEDWVYDKLDIDYRVLKLSIKYLSKE